jgi:Ca2+-binding EF-hand superfamily protein
MEKLGQNIRELQISLREAFEVFDTNKDGKI